MKLFLFAYVAFIAGTTIAKIGFVYGLAITICTIIPCIFAYLAGVEDGA